MSSTTEGLTYEKWDIEVGSKAALFDLKLKQIFKYKDLIFLLARRDIVVKYKQTILGPLWLIIQPLLTTAIFVIVFSRLAKLSTDNIPPVLFYLSGTILWSFIAECIRLNSNSFKVNAELYSKVYFPRVAVPLASSITSLFQFSIQLLLFLGFLLYYQLFTDFEMNISLSWLLLPLLLTSSIAFALGTGMIISSMTYKYRDLQFLVSFGIQLAMYATPVIYPLSAAPERIQFFLQINPATALIETFRFIFFENNTLDNGALLYSFIVSFMIFIVGLAIFNRTERNFMDAV